MAKSATARHEASDRALVFLPLTIRPVQVQPTVHTRTAAGPTMNIAYRYTDAGNWKYWGEFRVRGELSLAELRQHLFDREFFIPERIGLPSLVPAVKNEDDHLLHTFEDVVAVETAAYEMPAAELIERVRLANEEGWFAGIS